MPPHCDTVDVPVVTAARQALEAKDVNLILPYVQETGTADVKSAFKKVARARQANLEAREVADLYFFETVVRVHRAAVLNDRGIAQAPGRMAWINMPGNNGPKLLAAMSPVSYVTLDPNQQHRPVGIVVKRQPSIG